MTEPEAVSTYYATEIDENEYEWLRGRKLPEGAELLEVDEVAWWGSTFVQQRSGLFVPEDPDATLDRLVRAKEAEASRKARRPVGVDLFCGAGGFSLGLHEAGFDVLAAVESSVEASRTYLHNLGREDCRLHWIDDRARDRWVKECSKRRRRPILGGHEEPGYLSSRGESERGCREFFFGDAAALEGTRVRDAVGGDIDVVFGGPPCQGLSPANSKGRRLEEARNGMIYHFMRLVREIRPRTWMMENVPQILTIAGGALFEAIAQMANEDGYDVTAQKLACAAYGVPQHRVRALIVGSLPDCPPFAFPMPTHWAVGRFADSRRDWSFYDQQGKGVPLRKGKAAKFRGGHWQLEPERTPAPTPAPDRIEQAELW